MTIHRSVPVLRVADTRAAERFYIGLLGFRLEFASDADPTSPDPRYISVMRDGAVIHLSSHGGDAVPGGVAYLYVTDVDALHAEFVSRGVPIHVAPVDQTWGLREMYVRDPFGNSLRFGHLLPQ